MPEGYDRHANVAQTAELSDEQLRRRTAAILEAAQRISSELTLQTERLAAAIDAFDRSIIAPLGEVLGRDGIPAERRR
jgi:hypothetical protein